MRTFQRIVVFVGVVMLPATVFARATITGTARDPSGAVLPDVTVEAASPVLIEKVRTGVTDGAGIFQIRELRPGHLQRDVHAAGIQRGASPGRRAERQRRDAAERRTPRDHGRGNDHPHGRSAVAALVLLAVAFAQASWTP
jgi:carboxypeptidase family protein